MADWFLLIVSDLVLAVTSEIFSSLGWTKFPSNISLASEKMAAISPNSGAPSSIQQGQRPAPSAAMNGVGTQQEAVFNEANRCTAWPCES